MSTKDLQSLLSDHKKLAGFLRKVVGESMSETYGDLLLEEDEREMQKKLEDDLRPFAASEKTGEDESQDEGEEEPVKADKEGEEVEVDVEDTEASVLSPEELEEIDIDAVIDQLNSMRSGKSLKDEGVRKELSDYYEGLSSGEKKSMFAFLQGLSDIMSAGVPGADAPKPATYKIRTSASEPEKKEREEDAVVTASGDRDSEEEKVTPIVVGERSNKNTELKRLRELMRS